MKKKLTSYIALCPSDPRKGLELYDTCLKINFFKPPRYGKNAEILIPWIDWNNYAMRLFPTIEELESVDIYEYIWETDMKLKILSDDIIEKLYLTETKEITGMFCFLGNLVSESLIVDGNTVKFLYIPFFGEPEILDFYLDNHLPNKFNIEDELKYNLINKDVLYRRFINSDPKRFESLNNVIKNL